jgi:O-antigen ligase
LKIQRAIFYCLILSLIIYGINYHIAKGLIHLAVLLSTINIVLAIKNKSINNLSIGNPGILSLALLLLLSSAISAIYYMLYNNPAAERLFSNTFYITLSFSIIIPSIKVNKADGNILLYSAIASCIFAALAGIIDYISHGQSGYRTAGSINAPIIYATSMVLITTWVNVELFRSLLKKNWIASMLCFLGLCVGFVSIVLSGSRGPILASILIFVALLVHFFTKIPSNNKKTPFILIFTGFILLAMLSAFNSPIFDPIKNRFERGVVNVATGFQEGKRQATSAGLRLDMWEASLVTIYDHPFTGIGAGNHAQYFSTLNQEKRIDININSLMKFNHLHNDVVQAWVSMGIIFGTLFLLYILYLLIFFAYQMKYKESSIIGLFVCIAFILCGLTDVPAHSAVSLTLFLLITSLNISFLNSLHSKDSLITS